MYPTLYIAGREEENRGVYYILQGEGRRTEGFTIYCRERGGEQRGLLYIAGREEENRGVYYCCIKNFPLFVMN